MTVKFNGRNLPDGTLLLAGVKYPTSDKVYTYAFLKAGAYWYSTGQGPHAAGWAVVERWLEKDGREVVWVKGATGEALPTLWPAEPGNPVDRTDGTQHGVSDGWPSGAGRLSDDLQRQIDESRR